MKFFSSLPLAVSLTGIVHSILVSEPVCSRFDYDERILAKTIRLEMTIEDLMTKCETSARESEALKKKIMEIEAKLNASLQKKTETAEKAGICVCAHAGTHLRTDICVCLCMHVCMNK